MPGFQRYIEFSNRLATKTFNDPYLRVKYTWVILRNFSSSLSCTLSKNKIPKVGLISLYVHTFLSSLISTMELIVLFFSSLYNYKVQDVGGEKGAITFLRAPPHCGKPISVPLDRLRNTRRQILSCSIFWVEMI